MHVVGVGGAGMSALATLLVEMGAVVSGSDVAASAALHELDSRRVTTYVGHDASHVDDVDVLLWSPAVGPDNVELEAARRHGAELVPRARALGELSTMARVLGICGTHGKTTATSMMVHVASAADRDDGWLVGAPVLGVGASGHWGRGDLIVEVDESYGAFAEMAPYALGLLNLEADHLDHYGSLDELEAAFAALVERTTGPVIVWGGDPGGARVASRVSREVVVVGTDERAPWRVTDVVVERRGASFTLAGPRGSLDIVLGVTGAHNVANAAVVAALACEIGIAASDVVRGLANFLGAPRRYQFRGTWRGADVYDDYAHLPGEIAATVAAAAAAGYRRATVVFQPHRVTRTLALSEQFAHAFTGACHVVVTDLYDAGEDNPTAVTGEVVARALALADPSIDTRYCARLHDVPALLSELVLDSDVVLILGAGDVGSVIDALPASTRD